MDTDLRDFFTSMVGPKESQEEAAKKLHGFTSSLLTTLHDRLKAIALEDRGNQLPYYFFI